MRIGVFFPTDEQGTLAELEASIRSTVIDASLDSAWLPQSRGADALTAIAAMGSRLPGIELGTSVIPTYPRHPITLAMQALTANAAIDGRLTLGVGVSHRYNVEREYAYSYERPVRHMREYLSVLQPLMREGAVDFEGETLTGRTRMMLAGAQPPPVILAALQPKMLGLAGRLADGTVTWCTGPITLKEQVVPTIRAAADEAGRPSPRVLVALPVIVTDDVADGRSKADSKLPGYEKLPVYRAILDREGAATPGDVSIVGSASSVAEQLDQLAGIGADDFVAVLCGDQRDRLRTLDLLADVAGSR